MSLTPSFDMLSGLNPTTTEGEFFAGLVDYLLDNDGDQLLPSEHKPVSADRARRFFDLYQLNVAAHVARRKKTA